VDDAFLMSVLDSVAYGNEQFQPLTGGSLVRVAKLGNGGLFIWTVLTWLSTQGSWNPGA
jgi:hypothetical protein